MKKQLLVAGMVIITATSFGQKKELKKADKAIKSGNFTEALAQLDVAETFLDGAEDVMKSQFFAAKGEALAGQAKGDFAVMKKASEAFAKALELGGNTKRVQTGIASLRTALINDAIKDQNNKNFTVAAEKLFASYTISKDASDLYFAASNAVNGKDYKSALSHYQTLLDIGYTGEKDIYVATDKDTKEEKVFSSKNERDLMIKSGQFIKPEKRKEASRRGEILRNMTLIYVEQGEQDKALKLMKDARKANPNDVSLIRTEANMAFKMGDMEKYSSLMQEVIATDPNNPELYFNIGVSASKIGDTEKAMSYYKKAIELNPNYADPLVNIAILILDSEKGIVEEMNSLGNSRADNARYEVLTKTRNNMYKEAVPYLEKAIEARSGQDNTNLMKTLMNIYGTIGDDTKFREMKARIGG